MVLALCGATAATSIERGIWMQSRSQEWWDVDVQRFSEIQFINNFRLRSERLRVLLSREETQLRQPISVSVDDV